MICMMATYDLDNPGKHILTYESRLATSCKLEFLTLTEE